MIFRSIAVISSVAGLVLIFGVGNCLAQDKPVIPDEPSPFMDNSPKKPAAKAAKPPAAESKPAKTTGKPATPPDEAPAPVKKADAPAPTKVEEQAESKPAAPPAEPNAKKLAESDDLIQKAKTMWGLGEYAASLKLAEKARLLRISQLGEQHSKVAEVDAMIKAAKAKIPESE